MVVDKAVDGIVVNKAVDGIVVDKAVKQGVFKQVLLAKKSVMGLNKLLLLRTLIASNL